MIHEFSVNIDDPVNIYFNIPFTGSNVNWNNEFTLLDGEFFELKPGRNQIVCSGIQQSTLYVTPNWWTV